MTPALEDRLIEWEERRERGEAVSAADLCPDAPGLAPELGRLIGLLESAERLLDVRATEPDAVTTVAESPPRPPPDCRAASAATRCGPSWAGGDVRRLPGLGLGAAPRGGPEGAARRDAAGGAPAGHPGRPPRARGADPRPAAARSHRPHLRAGALRGPAVLRPGVRARRQPARPAGGVVGGRPAGVRAPAAAGGPRGAVRARSAASCTGISSPPTSSWRKTAGRW